MNSNRLYGTNVYATTRMAKHVAGILTGTDRAAAGPELVERMQKAATSAKTPVNSGGKKSRKARRSKLVVGPNHNVDGVIGIFVDSNGQRLELGVLSPRPSDLEDAGSEPR
jgi:hypothetical protein